MSIPTDVQAALDRLELYNSNPVSVSNPYGLSNYGNIVNFPLALSDIVTVAGWFGATGGLPGPQGNPGNDGADGADGTDGTNGTDGNDGWTPVLAIATDGARRVQQVVDWTGGEGTKPATGKYVGPTGLVTLIADAVDIRGAAGAGTGDVLGPSSSVNNRIALFDGTTGKLLKDSGVVLGTAASKDTGTGAGQVPLLDAGGKLDTSVLPALAINDIFVVNNQTAMLALTAQRGDVAVRSDVNKTFILSADTPATLSAWIELPVPANAVLSVAGLTGAITASALKAALALVAADVGITIATASELRTGTAGKYLDAAVIYSANAPVALVDGATITPDFAAGRNFTVTLGGNRALANPSNQVAGQSGVIIIKQDATGSRTLSWGSAFKFAGGAPTLSTAANSVDSVTYYVEAAGTFRCTFQKGYA